MTGWFHTNHIGLSPAPMTGMLLDFQMPAGINGIERMPTTTQDQTLYAAECSTQPAALNHSRPASRCVITKNNTQTGVQVLGELITIRHGRTYPRTLACKLRLYQNQSAALT